MVERLVHIVDDAEVLADAGDLTLVCVLTGFLDAGKSAELAASHLAELLRRRQGRRHLRRRLAPRLPRPPSPDDLRARPLHRLRGAPAGRPRAARHRRHAVPAARPAPSPTSAGRPSPAPCARWSSTSASRGSSAWVPCRWRCRTPGRSRSPRTPTAPSWSPARARGRASCGSRRARRRCWRSGWGSGAIDALGFVAHIPHYLAQMEYPQAALVLLEHLEIGGRLTIDLGDLREAAEITETEVDRYLSSHDEVGDVVRGLEQQYDSFREAEAAGTSLLAGDGTAARPARRSAATSRRSSPSSTTRSQGRRRRPGRLGRPLMAGSRRGARHAARARAARGRPLPRRPGPHRAPARLRRPGRRAGRGGRDPQRRGRVRPALAALLLPAPRRHDGPDRLRRRADPRRALLRHPPGLGAPARPPDLLHDGQLPDPRAGPRAPGPDARGGAARARACRWSSWPASAAPRPPSTGSASGRRSTSATSA